MIIQVNRAHFPVTVLGPGRRIGIWFQGCSVRCPGCMSMDTWEAGADRGIEVTDLLTWCEEVTHGKFDGVTISGGEPFDQPDALQQLLEGLHAWRTKLPVTLDILCYSGYPWRRLKRLYSRIVRLVDAIVPEPYVRHLSHERRWRGSANQPLIPLTQLGR